MFSQFELLNISHQMVLEQGKNILEVVSIKKEEDLVKIIYTSDDDDNYHKLNVNFSAFNISKNNRAVQTLCMQKHTYKKSLIISTSLAQSLTFKIEDSRKYILVNENYTLPTDTQEDYRKVLLYLNNWRYKAPIFKKALSISPVIFLTVNSFTESFLTFFYNKYHQEIVQELATKLRYAHDYFAEDFLMESLNYLKHYERKLSYLQIEKIYLCVLQILKNWVLCETTFQNTQVVTIAIKILNEQHLTPHLDKNVGLNVLYFHLKNFV